jgi:hypothetical protein
VNKDICKQHGNFKFKHPNFTKVNGKIWQTAGQIETSRKNLIAALALKARFRDLS